LWLSTLENSYDLARADAFDALFGQLAIGRAPTPRRNGYFVMTWNFSTVDAAGDAEAIRGALPRPARGRERRLAQMGQQFAVRSAFTHWVCS
jgi:hypothetical protein